MKNLIYKRRFLFIPIGVAAFLSLISYIVMQLWNNLLPNLIHVGAITFWQSMGIFILCKILFGFGGRGGRFGGGAPWNRERMHMFEKFKNMSAEEREQFKRQMGDRMCGHRGRRWGGNDWAQPNEATAPNA